MTLFEKFKEKYPELMAKESANLDATELICELMNSQKVKLKTLAKKLEMPASDLQKMLNGETDITVRVLGEALCHLGYEIKLFAKKLE